MTTKAELAFHPSEFIKEELEARGWSVDTLGEKSGLGRAYIEEILAKRLRITKLSALGLGNAFDTSMKFWQNLQLQWDMHNAPGPKNPPRHPTDREVA